MILSARTL